MKKNILENEEKAQTCTRMRIENFIGVRVEYISPTDYEGASVRLSLPRMSEEDEVTVKIPYDYAENNCPTMGAQYIKDATEGLLPIGQTQCSADSGGTDLLLYPFYSEKWILKKSGLPVKTEVNNYSLLIESIFSTLTDGGER
tara:strand:- start:2589 stop:3017 length:429 start_codon:yes stop_codon:yes gene_type:complete